MGILYGVMSVAILPAMPCLLLQKLLLLSLPDLETANVLSVAMETRLVSGPSALVRLRSIQSADSGGVSDLPGGSSC